MKFCTLALCTAGILSTGLAYAADPPPGTTNGNQSGGNGSGYAGRDQNRDMRQNERDMGRNDRSMRRDDRRTDRDRESRETEYRATEEYHYRTDRQTGLPVDPITGYHVDAGAKIYHRQVLFPEVPSYEEVAAKVTDLVQKQRQEAAELQALAPRARTAGFTNVVTVYDRMAQDHLKLATAGENWLSRHNFPVPPAPAAAPAADVAPEKTVDQQMEMHQKAFNEVLEARHGEKSTTVRTMELAAAATAPGT